jgi:transcriptional regulator with XRE-family HTH domain
MGTARNILGPQLMRIRNERGWSQADLARECQIKGWDVSRDIIARIESQVRWVGDFEVLEIARALGVPVVELFPKPLQKYFEGRK